MNKSQFAFEQTAQMMFERGPVILWTFTFREVYPDWNYSYLWDKFSRELANWFWGNVGGLRVVEAHREHGLHFHVLLNRRVPFTAIDRMARKHGFGHSLAEVADQGAIRYLVPYLRKQWRDRDPLHCGMRRWSAFGNIVRVRVGNVECDSRSVRLIKSCKIALNQSQFSYGEIQLLGNLALKDLDFPEVLARLMEHRTRCSVLSTIQQHEDKSSL